jgi:tetratricopeptide (TPR) repeat protein
MRAFLLMLALVILAPTSSLAQVEKAGAAARALAEAAREPARARDERLANAAAAFAQAVAGWDQAIQSLEAQARRELPTASIDRAWRLHADLGIAYRNRGRLADAIREFDAAARNSADPDLQWLRARTLEARGQLEAAAEAFRAAWTLAPNDPAKAYDALRRGLRDPEERAQAIAVLEQAYRQMIHGDSRSFATPLAVTDVLPDWASATPIVGDARTAAGFALLAAGRYSEAAAALTQIPSSTNGGAESPLRHFERAQSLEADGQVSEARREYAVALTGALSGRSVIYTAIGRLAQVEGDIPGAVDAYRQAVRLNPGDATMRMELANALVAQGSVDDAFVEIVGGLLTNPSSAPLYAGLGQLHLDAGQPDAAIPALTRALELSPDRYELRYAMATALARLGRGQEAAAQLEQFERVRRALLERRRTTIQQEVEKEEAIRRGMKGAGAAP